MDELAGEDRYRRQATHPALRDVHSVLLSPPLTGGSQGREVRHRCAGRQNAAPVPWKVEEILQPADGDLLELGAQRRANPHTGVVVEGGGEPIRRERRRRGTTSDEVEESGTGRVSRGLHAVRQEHGKRRQAAASVLRQLAN